MKDILTEHRFSKHGVPAPINGLDIFNVYSELFYVPLYNVVVIFFLLRFTVFLLELYYHKITSKVNRCT